MTSTDRLGVVYVTAPAPVGGLERVVQAQAIGMHRRGHTVRVVAVLDAAAPAEHPFLAPLGAAGVPVDEIRLTGRGYVAERRAVQRILRAARPDVLHTHGYRSDLLDAGVARRLGIATVSTMHGSSRLGGLSHVFEWLQLRAWRRFDAVVAVSEALRQMQEDAGGPAANVAVIPNAWSGVEPNLSRSDARRRLGLAHIPPDVPVLGFVARLIPAKGPDVFVDALARLRDRAWHAVLIGDGVERARLEARVDEAGLATRVTLAGHLDDATHLYPAFDVFVLSSRTEGTPIALFEAMAARCAVVATAVGGVPDVIGAGAGALVPPFAPDAIAEAVARWLDDPTAAAAAGTAARARVAHVYGPAAWLDQHEALYRRVSRRR